MRCFYSSSFDKDLSLTPVLSPLLPPAGNGQSFHPSNPSTLAPPSSPINLSSLSRELLLSQSILRPEDLIPVSQAPLSSLLKVHDPIYLGKIYHGTLSLKEQLQLGFLPSSELFIQGATEVEATRQTCHAALKEGFAISLAGGNHHSFHGQGINQCIFNDVALAINDLQESYPSLNIMTIDTESSQGNGTNSLLKNKARVFTYSIHTQGSYPFQRVDGSMDIETVRYVEGAMYLRQLCESLATALDQFSPDLIIWIAGSDPHHHQQGAPTMLREEDLKERDRILLKAFLNNDIPLALLYGRTGLTPQAAEIQTHAIQFAKSLLRKRRSRNTLPYASHKKT